MEGTATVAEVMTRQFLGVNEGDPVSGVVSLLLSEGADCAVVVRGEEAVGLLSERDLLAAVAGDGDLAATTAGSLAADPEPAVPATSTLSEAAAAMASADRRVLVVTEDGAPAGVVSAHDLATAPAALGPAPRAGAGSGGDAPPDVGGTDAPADAADPGARRAPGEGPDAAFTAQSVCERCGALAGDLRNFNGQLVCPDCRET